MICSIKEKGDLEDGDASSNLEAGIPHVPLLAEFMDFLRLLTPIDKLPHSNAAEATFLRSL